MTFSFFGARRPEAMFGANVNKKHLIANKEFGTFEKLLFEFAVNLMAKLQPNTKKRFPNLFVGTVYTEKKAWYQKNLVIPTIV